MCPIIAERLQRYASSALAFHGPYLPQIFRTKTKSFWRTRFYARTGSVNRNWLEVLGYKESEVIGHNPTEFLTEASRRYAEEVGRPKLFKTGYVTDVRYQMVKKSAM